MLPFEANRRDQGVVVTDSFQILSFDVQPIFGLYSLFAFRKSSQKTTYIRKFNKVDEFFSYVGGLIGTILGFMLFMNNFSLMAFELDLSQRFFKDKNGENNNFSNFNIFAYFVYLLYKAGSFCGLCKGWKETKKKVSCKDEMLKQLDIHLFLQRFSFLERSMECLLR